MTPLIRTLRTLLQEQTQQGWSPFKVPGIWVGSPNPIEFPSAAAFLLHQLSVIDSASRRHKNRVWTPDKALAYNCMVRHVTSYDHGPDAEAQGWRTTGTFLKLAGLIPYLLSMGVDTIILLPIAEIGTVGKKGTLGSPYSVKHQLHLDPHLAEPAVAMSVDDQARTMMELFHSVGIKVVLEVVLRTASLDSDLVPQHPEWFYWIDEGKRDLTEGGFAAPSFALEDVPVIKEMVERNHFVGLPEPTVEYREMFSSPPLRVEQDSDGWRGIAPKGKFLRVPGAFADWPVDDQQPLWTDVTYFRLHDHPHYNYMAYNTVRMYERDLESDEYRVHTLWNTIASIIPYYIRTLSIDGAMIDMGHALPRDLRRKVVSDARSTRPKFLLFEENFTLSQTSSDAGYDASVGYLPFDANDASKLKAFIKKVADRDIPIRYFSTSESHNTPRSASKLKCPEAVAATLSVLRVLTHGLGFLHAGIELSETTPINTGLGFTQDEASHFPPESLPLFSDVRLPWDADKPVLEAIRKNHRVLNSSSWWATASDDDDLVLIPTKKKDLIAFVRRPAVGRQGVLCVANLSSSHVRERVQIPKEAGVMFLAPHLNVSHAGKSVAIELDAWQCEYVFTLH